MRRSRLLHRDDPSVKPRVVHPGRLLAGHGRHVRKVGLRGHGVEPGAVVHVRGRGLRQLAHVEARVAVEDLLDLLVVARLERKIRLIKYLRHYCFAMNFSLPNKVLNHTRF